MLTHEDAIQFLLSQGISANRRAWNLGDCVVVPAYPIENSPLEAYEFVAWLRPGGGVAWDIVQFVRSHQRILSFATLDEACEAVMLLVSLQRPTDRCPNCGGIRDLRVRERNRETRLSWSLSTSCRACGVCSEADGVGTLPPDLRRLELAQNGTWAVTARAPLSPAVWQAIRRHLELNLTELATLKRRIPGHLFTGTLAEAIALLEAIIGNGGTAEIESRPSEEGAG